MIHLVHSIFFFFNETATTEIYTLSLHDALPILPEGGEGLDEGLLHQVCCICRVACHPHGRSVELVHVGKRLLLEERAQLDRKSTRLNSSHVRISYAVFCLKKKKQHKDQLNCRIV